MSRSINRVELLGHLGQDVKGGRQGKKKEGGAQNHGHPHRSFPLGLEQVVVAGKTVQPGSHFSHLLSPEKLHHARGKERKRQRSERCHGWQTLCIRG